MKYEVGNMQICQHCGEWIIFAGRNPKWYHKNTGDAWCKPTTKAEPKETA